MLAIHRYFILPALSLVWSFSCAPVKTTCEAYCETLCDRMKTCNVGDTSTNCANSCIDALPNDTQCVPAGNEKIAQLACDDLVDLFHCAEYCDAVCSKAKTCGNISDQQACAVACLQQPHTCKLESIEVRSCDNIKKETNCYQAIAQAGPNENVDCGSGNSGEEGDLCTSTSACRNGLSCRKESSTCGPCQTHADCNRFSWTHDACNKEKKCVYASCLIDDDCKDYSSTTYCSQSTFNCVKCKPEICPQGFTCDENEGCVQCYDDYGCKPTEKCDFHICYKRCTNQNPECGNGECLSDHCSDPVGTPCDKNKVGACGGAKCINVNASNTTVPYYCSRFCYGTSTPCPTGYDCLDLECRKTQ